MPRKYNKTEEKEQAFFFRWLSYAHPELRKVVYAIPNGGSRNIFEAHNMKLAGVTAGVPDVSIDIASKDGKHHGLRLEFKVKGRKSSPIQKDIQDALRQQNYRVEIVYSWNEAQQVFLEHCGLSS
jgi:hypothetical protein